MYQIHNRYVALCELMKIQLGNETLILIFIARQTMINHRASLMSVDHQLMTTSDKNLFLFLTNLKSDKYFK